MNNPTLIHVSEAGLERLQRELAHKHDEYARICEERRAAHELSGDGWHDNPHFNHLQQLEANLNHQIVECQSRLERARLFTPPVQPPTDQVRLGSIVLLGVEDERGYREEWWEIVAWGDTDRHSRQLGYETPLAQALLGLEIEEKAVFGNRTCEVLDLLKNKEAATA